jgi:hypothetical protein
VQVAPIKPSLKAPATKPLKLKCDQLLSSFAFNFNLRRYNTNTLSTIATTGVSGWGKYCDATAVGTTVRPKTYTLNPEP